MDDLSAARYALELAAGTILRELAEVRGRGPWFPALHTRLQQQVSRSKAPEGSPEAVAERWADTGLEVLYEVFRPVLLDEAIPDFRQMAAISADGAPNPTLAPAVVAGMRIAVQALIRITRDRPGGEEALRLAQAEAVREAEVQNIPGDADGTLKDRWIGASIAAIDTVFDAHEGA